MDVNEELVFQGALLRRFFDTFGAISYQRVPICRYLHYQFRYFVSNRWGNTWLKKDYPQLREEMERFELSTIYQWADGPYRFDPHPGETVLMRGGFGDIAAAHWPKERFILLSPNQAEVAVIKANRPDLTPFGIDSFYRDNPRAVEELNRQVTRVINAQKDDPVLGSSDLAKWFQTMIQEIVRVFDAVQRLFDSQRIGAALTISSIVWMDSAVNLIARANRVPSLTLQHGLILNRDLFCHVPILATRKVVWGQAMVEWYRRYGFPDSRVQVVGSPRFDVIYNRKWCGKQELHRKLGIDQDRPIMVYATGTEANTIVPLIIEGIRSVPDLYLLMLLHPSESALVDRYEQLAGGYPNCRVARYGEINLYDALSGADLFITHCSTAGLEAMLFNLPVITVEPFPSYFSYGDLGATIRVTDSPGLNQAVRKLLAEEDFRLGAVAQYQRFLSEYCQPGGEASRRLFDELDLLLETGGIA